MRLVDDWHKVLKRAWSIRLMALAALLSGFEVVLPMIGDQLPISTGLFAALSFITVAAAFIARLIAQSNIRCDE